jgi:hypothetical protein
MANGLKVLSMAMAFGEDCTMTRTSASGFKAKLMAMVCIHGGTEIDMKVSGTCV